MIKNRAQFKKVKMSNNWSVKKERRNHNNIPLFHRYDKGNRRQISICRQWEDTPHPIPGPHPHLNLRLYHKLQSSTSTIQIRITSNKLKLVRPKVPVVKLILTSIHPVTVMPLKCHQRHLASEVQVTIHALYP